jgi:hypothetical protein
MSSIPSQVSVVKDVSTLTQRTATVYGTISFGAGLYETGGLPVAFSSLFPSNNLFRVTFHSNTGSGITYTFIQNPSIPTTGTVLIAGATNGSALSSTVTSDVVAFEAVFIR